MRFKNIVTVLLILFTFGCAQRIIVQDTNGIILPRETVDLKNPDKQIEVQALFLCMVEVSPESFYPKYLSPTKINKISLEELEKTKEVILFVRIFNPKKANYKLWKRLRYGDGIKDYKDTLLYEGNEEVKHFQMSIPKIPGKMYQVMAVLEYGDGFPMMYLGYFDVLYNNE